MKVFIALILLVGSISARPEIGIEKKFETSREISAQQLTPLTDPANFAEMSETNEQMRTPKDRQIYLEGAQIPVQLIYESDDGETQAVVKEVSMESIFRKPQGKLLNRVERSEVTDFKEKTISSAVNNLPEMERSNVDEVREGLEGDKRHFEIHPQQSKEVVPQISSDEEELLPVDADELNKGLGIEVRHGHKGIESHHVHPSRKNVSPMDFNYNVAKEMIKSINNNGKNTGVRRTIQHYQSLLQSMRPPSSLPVDQGMFNGFDGKTKLVKVVSYYPVLSTVTLTPPPGQEKSKENEKILDDYFPFVVHNPFNTMWSALTNIVEYGPEADVCKNEGKTKRRKRELADDQIVIPQSLLDDLSRHHSGFGIMRPNIMKLKVRRGGIAIAGPGGIATAGSGGTTIVGPGGTAYTPPDATAVVGPGGRVVHIPSFDSPGLNSRSAVPDLEEIIKRGKVVAHGPIVLYNPSSLVESS